MTMIRIDAKKCNHKFTMPKNGKQTKTTTHTHTKQINRVTHIQIKQSTNILLSVPVSVPTYLPWPYEAKYILSLSRYQTIDDQVRLITGTNLVHFYIYVSYYGALKTFPKPIVFRCSSCYLFTFRQRSLIARASFFHPQFFFVQRL